MTSPRHRSGTDRIAEAVEELELENDAIVVNIQGDQPLFEPSQVDEVVGPLAEDPSIPMSTLIYQIIRDEEITHPNAVKVVFELFALSPSPFVQTTNGPTTTNTTIYAYRRPLRTTRCRRGPRALEAFDSSDLEHGYHPRRRHPTTPSRSTPEELGSPRLLSGQKQSWEAKGEIVIDIDYLKKSGWKQNLRAALGISLYPTTTSSRKWTSGSKTSSGSPAGRM
jgi:3-deoxy-manno-octulosonate cytidylyltransferase (CMP-KDO synthetase)